MSPIVSRQQAASASDSPPLPLPDTDKVHNIVTTSTAEAHSAASSDYHELTKTISNRSGKSILDSIIGKYQTAENAANSASSSKTTDTSV